MKRRKFLTIAGLGAIIGAVASDKFMTTTFESSAAKLIKDELAFLQLDDEGVRAFTRDYSQIKRKEFKVIVKGYTFLGIDSSQSGKIHHIVSTYLLSSDFFTNKMDEKRVIKYVALYDPYRRPCVHPFSYRQTESENPESIIA